MYASRQPMAALRLRSLLEKFHSSYPLTFSNHVITSPLPENHAYYHFHPEISEKLRDLLDSSAHGHQKGVVSSHLVNLEERTNRNNQNRLESLRMSAYISLRDMLRPQSRSPTGALPLGPKGSPDPGFHS